MSGGLKPGLCCPVCGRSVLGVYHEWHGTEDTALFEYHHDEDAERDRRGEAPAPCVVVLPYEEGRTRFRQESGS